MKTTPSPLCNSNTNSKAASAAVHKSTNPEAGTLPRGLSLAQHLGNQDMQRLLNAAVPTMSRTPRAFQAKLRIGASNDPLEAEADRVAEQVLRMPDSAVAKPGIEPALSCPVSVQSRCQECENEQLQRRQQDPSTAMSVSGLDTVSATLRQTGRPLDIATRAFFEPRFGHNFGAVRIHTDSHAVKSARAVNALAYTVGRDVVFNSSQYAPQSDSGKRLLAHELTHVVQQRGAQRGIQRQTEGLSASTLVPTLSEAPYGDQHCLPQHSCSVPAATPVSGAPLSAAQVASQRSEVRTAITRSRATCPIAAGNLEHWLDRTGTTSILPGSIFQAANSGVPRFLEHGLGPNLAHLEVFREGIQRRLATSDPESLMPAGTRRVLRFCNSMRFLQSRGGVEADLSIALGGSTVKSWVTLSLRTVPTSLPVVTRYQATVESWRVQVCDRYDWNLGEIASMPFPVSDTELAGLPLPEGAIDVTSVPGTGYSSVRLHDDWFRRLEAAGGGRQYALYSEIFDAPTSLRTLLEGFTFTTI